jgi:glycine/D-amino acid oxidase-like deaminating enzyme
LKAALHKQGPEASASGEWNIVDTDALARIQAWVGSRFEGVDAKPTEVEACLYTSTPDERFIVDRHGRVVIGSACSGQGFQFAPDTGEQLARLAT